MFPLQIKVTGYSHSHNTCEAVLPSGQAVEFDPFVSGALELSDEDYTAGKGAEIIGKTFLLTQFGVSSSSWGEYSYVIMPIKGGISEVTE